MTQCHDIVRPYHVPPSVEEVFCTLYRHTPMTGAELREATGRPRRTVYEALRHLKQIGLLRERPSLKDTRQTLFWIAEPATAREAQALPSPA
jgi:DNA-binding transcriptional regulator GbsR (MarR family)